MINQKCGRCGHTLVEMSDGWAKCPKCGLNKFVGVETETTTPAPVAPVKTTSHHKKKKHQK
jgi:uncharacterized Zn finger protein (UPF0148 family)